MEWCKYTYDTHTNIYTCIRIYIYMYIYNIYIFKSEPPHCVYSAQGGGEGDNWNEAWLKLNDIDKAKGLPQREYSPHLP